MNIKIINKIFENPSLYEKGSHTMWTDEYISKQLLLCHLDDSNELASRGSVNINKTKEFILGETTSKVEKILDLGCGPGLYTSKLAIKGFNLTGIDFSKNSIKYAKEQSRINDINIEYKCMNYLDIDYDNEFDLIILIFCDFGVFSKNERDILVKKIYKALKKDGTFIFDSLNHASLENMKFDQSWTSSDSGFWSPNPYICISKESHFPNNKAILSQHIVIEEDNNHKYYNFWNHYFSLKDIKNIFLTNGFLEVKEYKDIVDDSGVNFYSVKK